MTQRALWRGVWRGCSMAGSLAGRGIPRGQRPSSRSVWSWMGSLRLRASPGWSVRTWRRAGVGVGQPVAEDLPGLERADLTAAGIGDGFHAFHVALPAELADGLGHTIEVL